MASAPVAPTHTMKCRYLDNSGLLVSRLSFGSWVRFDGNVGFNAAYDIMVKAFQGGINFLEKAEGYAWGNNSKGTSEGSRVKDEFLK